jgi:methylenetetrahydrofolate reductase (NADPH)
MALANLFKSKDFAVIAEMATPKGVDISDFVENARNLKGRVDAVLLPDMDFAVMRMSALAGAMVLKEQGLTPIVQFCCRDRNRISLQGDLLGAHVLGIENVMAVKGHPVEMGDQLDAKGVYDLNPADFVEAVSSLGQGRDMAGKELKGRPGFCMGVRLEPFADEAEMQVRIAEAKTAVDKGAAFVITPWVFDIPASEKMLAGLKELGAPVIASVMLLKSVGMARYMNQNIPGVEIKEDSIRRIRQATDRQGECVKIAAETIKALKGHCSGALLVASGWENRLPDILSAAGY